MRQHKNTFKKKTTKTKRTVKNRLSLKIGRLQEKKRS